MYVLYRPCLIGVYVLYRPCLIGVYVLYRPCLIGVYVLYRPCLIGVYVLYRPCLIGVYVLYRPCLIGVYVLYRPCLIGVYVLYRPNRCVGEIKHLPLGASACTIFGHGLCFVSLQNPIIFGVAIATVMSRVSVVTCYGNLTNACKARTLNRLGLCP